MEGDRKDDREKEERKEVVLKNQNGDKLRRKEEVEGASRKRLERKFRISEGRRGEEKHIKTSKTIQVSSGGSVSPGGRVARNCACHAGGLGFDSLVW